MTNPYPGYGLYSPTGSDTSNSTNPRRLSYASVARGIGSARPTAQSPPLAQAPTAAATISSTAASAATAPAAATATITASASAAAVATAAATTFAGTPATGANSITAATAHSPRLFRHGSLDSSLHNHNRPLLHDFTMGSNKFGYERAWPRQSPYQYQYSDNSLPLADDLSFPTSAFVWPSYLADSRHLERLEAEHHAIMAAARDRRRGRHAVYSKDAPPSSSAAVSASSSSVNLNKLASTYHRSGIQEAIDRFTPVKLDDTLKKLPICWSDVDKCAGLELLNDSTEVRFQGVTKQSDEAAAVRTDHPIPKEVGLYYFEVTILSKGREGLIGIGFSSPKASLNRLPGWEPESWGYHGDDGFSFSSTASGKNYGPKFSHNDVIGCGINFRTGSAFFTKNGVRLADAFHGIKSDRLYPSVGVKKTGEHLRANFGADRFVYSIEDEMEAERVAVQKEVEKADVKALHPVLTEDALIQELIAQYLAHDGYVETIRAFADEVHQQRQSLSANSEALKTFDPAQDIHAINRQKIRSAILEGDIDCALKYTATYYPHVLERDDNRDVYFKLRCRKFIEMMRRCNDMQSAANNVSSPPSNGKMPDRQTHHNTPHGHGDLDYQMELDEQLQRESRPPTVPPISIPSPIDPNSFTSHAGADTDDSMDTTPDPLKPAVPAEHGIKPNMMKHNVLLTQALDYGRELRAEFSNDPRAEVKQALNDTFALIAYTNAKDSVVGGLMDGKGRVEIAEEINSAILVSLGKPSSAGLERIVAQTEVLTEMLSHDGGPGAFVNVTKDCFR